MEFKHTVKYAGLLLADAIEEFKVDGNTLEPTDGKAFNYQAMNVCKDVVRTYLKKVL